jgi:hypothetical protein
MVRGVRLILQGMCSLLPKLAEINPSDEDITPLGT